MPSHPLSPHLPPVFVRWFRSFDSPSLFVVVALRFARSLSLRSRFARAGSRRGCAVSLSFFTHPPLPIRQGRDIGPALRTARRSFVAHLTFILSSAVVARPAQPALVHEARRRPLRAAGRRSATHQEVHGPIPNLRQLRCYDGRNWPCYKGLSPPQSQSLHSDRNYGCGYRGTANASSPACGLGLPCGEISLGVPPHGCRSRRDSAADQAPV